MKELTVKYIVLLLVLSLLPVSPFTRFVSYFENIPYLAVLNYFVPVSEILVVWEIWLVTVALFYVIMWVLNFVGLLKN